MSLPSLIQNIQTGSRISGHLCPGTPQYQIEIKKRSKMNSGSALRVCSLVLVIVLLAAEMTSAAPYNDYDTASERRPLQQTYFDVHPYPGSVFFPDLRDLYELLLRNEAAAGAPASTYNHQMERKGGRSPSLRLRFGRRADPLWHAGGPASDAVSN